MKDNYDRAQSARKALACGNYEPLENTFNIELPLPDGGIKEVEGGYPISDLIADLLSLAQYHELDPMHKISEGVEHWGADMIEQAWMNADDWADTLQDEGNYERAEEILRINKVPEIYWEGVLAKVGLIGPDDPRHPLNKEDA